MLDDLRLLFAQTPPEATRSDYISAVVEGNVLGKPTRKSRELALRHMATLYALVPANPIFRALRRLWPLNEAAQPPPREPHLSRAGCVRRLELLGRAVTGQ